MTDKITLDPDNEFEAALIDMVTLFRKKSADYTGNKDLLQNFFDSAYFAVTQPGTSAEVIIGTKFSRIRELVDQGKAAETAADAPLNEPFVDSVVDRANYCVFAIILQRRGGYRLEPYAPGLSG